jgi:rhodanese-related sulfurtransferase
MQAMNPSALSTLLSATGATPPLLLDVREEWEFSICQIEGSRNIPMSAVPAAVPGLDRAAATVVICHHGIRSAQVAHYLERCGFTNVINLEGGIDAWAREVDPSMSTY